MRPISLKYLLATLALLLAIEAFAKPRAPKTLAQKFFMQTEARDLRIAPGNEYLSFIGYQNGKSVLKSYSFENDRFYYTRRNELNAEIYDYYWIDRDQIICYAHKLGQPAYIHLTNSRLSRDEPTQFVLAYDLMPDVKNRLLVKEEGRKGEKFFDLYRHDVSSQSHKLVAKNPGHIIVWYTDKHANPRIRHYVDENEKDQLEHNYGEEEWKLLPYFGEVYALFFTNEPQKIIVFYRPDGEPFVLGRHFDIATSQFYGEPYSDPNYDLIPSEYILDPETEDSFGFHYITDRLRTVWFDPQHQSIQSAINANHPDSENKVIGFGPNGSVIYERSSDTLPPEWVAFDPSNQSERTVVRSMPWIDPKEMSETRILQIPNREGIGIHTYITTPRDSKDPNKTIAMIHGGPRARDFWGWDREAQYFAALGYTVIKVNYRGSEGFGTDYSPYNHMHPIRNAAHDVADVVKWSIKNGYSDPEKIAIYGSSFGGHVALHSAAEYGDLYQCAIGYAGVYDWVKEFDREFKEEPIYYRLKLHTYYGDYDNEKDKWLAASTVEMVNDIDIPIFLIHGRADEVVAHSQSKLMNKKLKKAKKDVTLKLLSFNRHGLFIEKQTIDFYEALSAFTEKRLN
ncbi:MAG: prolyl oligopeptidase family serine peptidase [Verrucomicrobiota bacterium]